MHFYGGLVNVANHTSLEAYAISRSWNESNSTKILLSVDRELWAQQCKLRWRTGGSGTVVLQLVIVMKHSM